MRKIIILSAIICTTVGGVSAQMTTSPADGFGSELNKRVATQFGSTYFQDGIDPYMAFSYTNSPKTIGYTAFGNTNLLRGFGTVGAGITYSFLKESEKSIENHFFGQITAGIGADMYSTSAFQTKANQQLGQQRTRIGVMPSFNVLLYGTTINNVEKGGMTIEGYLRIGKLSPSYGWVQAQYNFGNVIGGSVYWSNDVGPMLGTVLSFDQCRVFLGGNLQGARLGFSISNF